MALVGVELETFSSCDFQLLNSKSTCSVFSASSITIVVNQITQAMKKGTRAKLQLPLSLTRHPLTGAINKSTF